MSTQAALLLSGNLAVFIALGAVSGWLMYQRVRHVSPGVVAILEQTIADTNRQLSEMREQQNADHLTIRQLRAEIGRVDDEWRAAYTALAQEFREAVKREPRTRPPQAAPPAAPIAPTPARRDGGMAAMARRMAERFSLEEVDDLAFELGLADAVTGETLGRRAASLVTAANKSQVLSELVDLCRARRPEGGF